MKYFDFSFIFFFLSAVLLSVFFSFFLVRLGGVAQDIPNDRSSHLVPTPRGGGVAFSFAFFLMLVSFFCWKHEYLSTESVTLALTWLAVAVLGFFEDRFGVPAKVRLLVQFLAATVLVSSGFYWNDLGLFALSFSLPQFFCSVVSLFFIVWVTNLYNFMDGIDGIAAIQGLIVSSTFCAVGLVDGNVLLSVVSGLLFVSVLGFLPFNFPKARIFMGDSGSLFLGFVFVTLPFLSQGAARLSLEFFAVVIGPFLADTLITLFIRIRRRENLAEAHRSHFYQKFQMLVGSHIVATLTYGILGILFALVGLIRLYGTVASYRFALAGSLLFLAGFFLWVHRKFHLRYELEMRT